VLLIILAMYGLLIYRVYNLQITQHSHFRQLAKQNQLRVSHTYPSRGAILDRNGAILAKNIPSYHVCYNPHSQAAHIDYLLENSLNHDEKNKCVVVESWHYAHVSTWDDITLFVTDKRSYPLSNATSHIIGYTSKKSFKPSDSLASIQQQGAAGVEKQYDQILRGQAGQMHAMVNAKGEKISQIEAVEAIPCPPIETTIDAHLQQKAHHELFMHHGTVIILNPNTGEILCAVSNPSFDPHQPLEQHPTQKDNTQMFNRLTQARYPPGSVLKPIIALLALEDKILNPNEKIESPGYIEIGTQRFHDWVRTGHGIVDLKDAIRVSSDVYFYKLAQKVGINRLVDYLILFGLDKKTNIDIPHEKKSIIPTYENRKQRAGGWYEGHTIMTAIGQGDFAITPISLARATMLLANKGYDHQLHLNPSQRDIKTTPRIQSSDKHWNIIHNALLSVTTDGTAKSLYNQQYSVAGKTGTAQVKSIKSKAEYRALPKHLKDHHLFIGFSPVEKPQVAIVVIIEHEHKAVLLAKHMLDFYWHNFTKSNEKLPLSTH
ncbi:penicillin-binding transpeptidase domain-containing protein, partial [Gammaproteobacteria bacterium]|nr:penicillin-binding transpeptidase domain-containing protein [Gammaproteobacteria bacterium]